MSVRVQATRYGVSEFIASLPAVPEVVRSVATTASGAPVKRRSAEEIAGLPGTRMSLLVPVSELLPAVWSMESPDGANFTFPRSDGTNGSSRVRVYLLDDVEVCTAYGTRVAEAMRIPDGAGSHSTFSLIIAFCGGDATLASRLCVRFMDNPEALMELLAGEPDFADLTAAAARPGVSIARDETPYDDTEFGVDDFPRDSEFGTPDAPTADAVLDAALAKLTVPAVRRTLASTVDSVPDISIAGQLTHLAWTQYGMTERWCAYFGGMWKRHPDKGMMRWSGKVWEPADVYDVRRSVMATIRATGEVESTFYEKKEDDDRQAGCRGFAKGFENRGHNTQIAEAIMSLPTMSTKLEEWDADDDLINTPLGILDFHDPEGTPPHPHDPARMMTMITKASGNPLAKSKDLDAILANLEKSGEGINRATQGFAGASITGLTHDAILQTHGFAGVGKSSYWEALALGMGGGAATSYSATAMIDVIAKTRGDGGDRPMPALEALRGKRMFYIDEAGGCHLNEPLVKTMAGGARLRTRALNQAGSEWSVKFTLVMNGNTVVLVTVSDSGMIRRFVSIEITEASKIADEDVDQMVRDRLLYTQEGIDAVFAWAVTGARAMFASGMTGLKSLGIPATVMANAGTHLKDMNPLRRWLDDCTEDAPTQSSPDAPTLRELELSFNRWSKSVALQTNQAGPVIASMPKSLAAAGYVVPADRGKRTRKNGTALRGRYVDGLRLIPLPYGAYAPNEF
ncbi:MAG: hypothetical protein HHJ13_00310 [Phycicoccus sp.]|nr:hypothetical protein [Phycicoccus sp.]